MPALDTSGSLICTAPAPRALAVVISGTTVWDTHTANTLLRCAAAEGSGPACLRRVRVSPVVLAEVPALVYVELLAHSFARTRLALAVAPRLRRVRLPWYFLEQRCGITVVSLRSLQCYHNKSNNVATCKARIPWLRDARCASTNGSPPPSAPRPPPPCWRCGRDGPV